MILIFAIMLLSLYLISLTLTNYGKKNIEEQYLDSLLSKVNFYGDLLDDHILFLSTRQLQLFSDSDVEKLSFLGNLVSGYEEVALINGVKEELYMIKNSSDLVANNGVFIKSYDQSISIDGGLQQFNSYKWNETNEKFITNRIKNVYFMDDKVFLVAMDKGKEVISYIQLSEDKLLEKISKITEGKNDAGVFLVEQSSGYVNGGNESNQAVLDKVLSDHAFFEKNKMNVDLPKNNHSSIVKINGSEYLVTSSEISFLDMTLYTYINREEMTEKLTKLSFGFLILTIISFLIFLIFSWSVNKMIHKPLNKLLLLFKSHQKNREGDTITTNYGSEFSYLFYSFNEMTDRLDRYIKDNYMQKLAIQKSELKQLQSQINPHFLYNSFYNIYRLSKMNDLDQVSILSQKLASYYQFITKSGSGEIEFEKELRHALDYCIIQKIRFSNRFSFCAPELIDDAKQLLVPRLIIQPVIENAFEHAFEHMEEGILHIDVSYVNKNLLITIEDNGDQLKDARLFELQNKLKYPEKEVEKTGIFNVCSRLKLRYGDESGLYVSRSSLGGLKVEMKIKF